MMDRLQHEGEGQARGLAPMDQGGSEGQARGLGAEGPKQWWRACKAKFDGLEVYVMVWVIHITYDDQAKDSCYIKWLGEDVGNTFLVSIIHVWIWISARQRYET
jgi:hypothetical protein